MSSYGGGQVRRCASGCESKVTCCTDNGFVAFFPFAFERNSGNTNHVEVLAREAVGCALKLVGAKTHLPFPLLVTAGSDVNFPRFDGNRCGKMLAVACCYECVIFCCCY